MPMLEKMMDLLTRRLTQSPLCRQAWFRYFAGTSFLYVVTKDGATRGQVDALIREQAGLLTQETELFYESTFVRKSDHGWVYRFRFRYPEGKSFCCGNQCPDCILLNG
jgi:hypothetical protein